VPYTIGYGDAVDLLSLAGRYVTDELFLTYYNVGGNSDINYKTVNPSTATSQLRIAPGKQVNQFIHTLRDMLDMRTEKNKIVTVTLFDLKGKEVMRVRGILNEIKNEIKKFNSGISGSLYLAKAASEDGSYLFAQKIVISN
jgi:hypothetical protein